MNVKKSKIIFLRFLLSAFLILTGILKAEDFYSFYQKISPVLSVF
jgi:hypothetical protein